MGVRGLQGYLQNCVENGYVEVSIVDEIEKYKKDKQQNPVLVIDLLPFFHLMFQNKRDMIYGGRWKNYSETLDDLLIKLKATGVELVFFEDGLIESSKYKTWIKRQNQRYFEHVEVIDHVHLFTVTKLYISFESALEGFSTVIPIMKDMAKKHGTLKYSVTKDCDVEMVRYANEHNVLAIISDDTDFLIFKGDWKLWSTRKINANTLKTFELNRKALRRNLNLTDDQLVILSTIAGNDFIQFEEIEKAVGENFRFSGKWKFPNIAKYIRDERLAEESIYSRAIKITSKMLGNTRPDTLKRVQDSLNAYNYDFKDLICSPLLQLCLDNHADMTFKVLRRFPKNFTLVFCDLRRLDIPSYHDMVVPLFQRQLGILFFDRKNVEPDLKFEIYSRQSHEGSFEKLLVEPIYPTTGQVPPLIELLDPVNRELDEVRFFMLKWMISVKLLKGADLQQLPTCYFLDVLTLVLMKAVGAISVDEADIFLYTSMIVERNEVPDDIKYPKMIDRRALRLAFAFGKVRRAVSNALKSIGFYKFLTISKFDGVLFHKSYLQFKDVGRTFDRELGDLAEFRYYERAN